MTMPVWVDQYLNEEFESSPRMTAEGNAWIKASRAWVKKFVKKCNGTDLKFSKGHFEWSAFFKVYDQWWYIASGDVRYKIMKEFLIRKCDSPTDYAGRGNQWVMYNEQFETNLYYLIMKQS